MPNFEALTVVVEDYGYLAVFVTMFFEGLCIPIPSELILGFAGFLVYQGKFSFAGSILTGWLGSLCGSLTVYALARTCGRTWLYRYCHLVRLSPDKLEIIAKWFNRFGPPLIIPWRQIPVFRTKISIAAGLLGMRTWVFVLNTAIGIAVWCTLAVSLGYYFGRNWHRLVDIFSRLGTYIVAVVILAGAAGLGFFLYMRHQKTKGDPR